MGVDFAVRLRSFVMRRLRVSPLHIGVEQGCIHLAITLLELGRGAGLIGPAAHRLRQARTGPGAADPAAASARGLPAALLGFMRSVLPEGAAPVHVSVTHNRRSYELRSEADGNQLAAGSGGDAPFRGSPVAQQMSAEAKVEVEAEAELPGHAADTQTVTLRAITLAARHGRDAVAEAAALAVQPAARTAAHNVALRSAGAGAARSGGASAPPADVPSALNALTAARDVLSSDPLIDSRSCLATPPAVPPRYQRHRHHHRRDSQQPEQQPAAAATDPPTQELYQRRGAEAAAAAAASNPTQPGRTPPVVKTREIPGAGGLPAGEMLASAGSGPGAGGRSFGDPVGDKRAQTAQSAEEVVGLAAAVAASVGVEMVEVWGLREGSPGQQETWQEPSYDHWMGAMEPQRGQQPGSASTAASGNPSGSLLGPPHHAADGTMDLVGTIGLAGLPAARRSQRLGRVVVSAGAVASAAAPAQSSAPQGGCLPTAARQGAAPPPLYGGSAGGGGGRLAHSLLLTAGLSAVEAVMRPPMPPMPLAPTQQQQGQSHPVELIGPSVLVWPEQPSAAPAVGPSASAGSGGASGITALPRGVLPPAASLVGASSPVGAGLALRLRLRCPDVLAHRPRRRGAPRGAAGMAVEQREGEASGLVSQLVAWNRVGAVPLTQLDDSAEGVTTVTLQPSLALEPSRSPSSQAFAALSPLPTSSRPPSTQLQPAHQVAAATAAVGSGIGSSSTGGLSSTGGSTGSPNPNSSTGAGCGARNGGAASLVPVPPAQLLYLAWRRGKALGPPCPVLLLPAAVPGMEELAAELVALQPQRTADTAAGDAAAQAQKSFQSFLVDFGLWIEALHGLSAGGRTFSPHRSAASMAARSPSIAGSDAATAAAGAAPRAAAASGSPQMLECAPSSRSAGLHVVARAAAPTSGTPSPNTAGWGSVDRAIRGLTPPTSLNALAQTSSPGFAAPGTGEGTVGGALLPAQPLPQAAAAGDARSPLTHPGVAAAAVGAGYQAAPQPLLSSTSSPPSRQPAVTSSFGSGSTGADSDDRLTQFAEDLLTVGCDLLAHAVACGAVATARLIMGLLMTHGSSWLQHVSGSSASARGAGGGGAGGGESASGSWRAGDMLLRFVLECCRAANGSGQTLLHLAVMSRSAAMLRLVAVSWPRDLGLPIWELNRLDRSGRSPADYLPPRGVEGSSDGGAGGNDSTFEAEAEALLLSLGPPPPPPQAGYAGSPEREAAFGAASPPDLGVSVGGSGLAAVMEDSAARGGRLLVAETDVLLSACSSGDGAPGATADQEAEAGSSRASSPDAGAAGTGSGEGGAPGVRPARDGTADDVASPALAQLLLSLSRIRSRPASEAPQSAPPSVLLWAPAACLLSASSLGAAAGLLLPLRALAARPWLPAAVTTVGRCTAFVLSALALTALRSTGRAGGGSEMSASELSVWMLLMTLAPTLLEMVPAGPRAALLSAEQAALLMYLLLAEGLPAGLAWLPCAAANLVSGVMLAAMMDMRARVVA
ncbi:hypothetical protein GPECTOR_30g242 [Gonium pectorale]|uniref:Uncharacterized protein n=1 Tax=Gonium pectorale TaxID=33097 RepID=A0A150GE88_GONPE|nr:hypothetical protein GPECTOR_30g242 [Gonium pectorale]|eukprot:KXZ48146.1 hypothetical protein GPECTOR_30g242 [Gonium pectorale]